MGVKLNPFTGKLDVVDSPSGDFNELELNAGTASAPSIAFAGDTGIYSPGADQLAISTGGTGRLFVDAGGDIGIGVSAPGTKLHIVEGLGTGRTPDSNAQLMIDRATDSGIQIIGGTSNYARIFFGDIDNGTIGRIAYNNADDSLAFNTNASERLRITSDGKLGLGTASPAHALTVNGGFPQIGIPDGLGNYSTIGVAQGGSGQGNLIISASTSADQTIFERGGSESCRIDGSGRLLVGTSTSITANITGLNFTGIREQLAGTDGNSSTKLIAQYSTVTTLCPTLAFAKSQNGTLLNHTAVTSGGKIAQISATGSDGAKFIEGGRIEFQADAGFATDSAPTRLVFSVTAAGASTPTEALRIDSAGNVGIGTTSPGKKLAVGASDISLQTATFEGSSRSEEYRLLRSDTGSANGMAAIGMNGAGTNGYLGEIKFYTGVSDLFNTSLQERARIDSSGRLLVGTSSARANFNNSALGAQFQIEGTGFSNTAISSVRSSNDQYSSAFVFGKNRGSVGGNTIVQDNDELGQVFFSGNDGSEFVNGASIAAFVDGTPGANDMPGRLVFSTTADGASSPTERMRIDGTGAVLIDTTTRTINTVNYGSRIGGGGAPGVFQTARNVDGTGTTASFYGNAGVLNVKGDGDCENTNNSYAGISDVRLKENIINANSQWDDLRALQVRKYNFKSETGFNTHTQIGLIAQEVELVSPGLVGESIDEETGESTKSVNYSVLYMKAVKALQEAMERIETLEAKVAALEAS